MLCRVIIEIIKIFAEWRESAVYSFLKLLNERVTRRNAVTNVLVYRSIFTKLRKISVDIASIRAAMIFTDYR
jgi:hypothetical protein